MSESLPSTSSRDELVGFLDHDVVLDTRGGELLYIGRLTAIHDWFFELSEADVHDRVDSRTTKEVYIMEAARHGIRKNRHSVLVRQSEVVSISRLDQVIVY